MERQPRPNHSPTRYLMLFLLRNLKGAAWGWQSASRSSKSHCGRIWAASDGGVGDVPLHLASGSHGNKPCRRYRVTQHSAESGCVGQSAYFGLRTFPATDMRNTQRKTLPTCPCLLVWEEEHHPQPGSSPPDVQTLGAPKSTIVKFFAFGLSRRSRFVIPLATQGQPRTL
jgi:hypothetical protein